MVAHGAQKGALKDVAVFERDEPVVALSEQKKVLGCFEQDANKPAEYVEQRQYWLQLSDESRILPYSKSSF